MVILVLRVWMVFQGNQVVNQSWEQALFMDLGSSPATMEGSRAADLYGCAPGHDIMQADAPQRLQLPRMKELRADFTCRLASLGELFKHLARLVTKVAFWVRTGGYRKVPGGTRGTLSVVTSSR